MLQAIGKMGNENQASDKDSITKEAIDSTLVGFCENLFKNADDKPPTPMESM